MDPHDLATLFFHRETLAGLDPGGRPRLVPLDGTQSWRSVALLPGSFNPPTAAHVLLGERALSEGYDGVVFVLARDTAGKEPTGLASEDRLLALRATRPEEGCSVAVCSHGLYADQAEAAAEVFPDAELTFLVGSDKVLQIFDDAWYEDRDAALERLFSKAAFVAAPRSDDGERLRGVLNDPRNKRWADRVSILRLHPAVSDLSSTHVRGLLRAGADPAGLVPPAVASFLADVRAFAPPISIGNEEVDAYGIRARLIELLWGLNSEIPQSVDLRALVETALSADADGSRLRGALGTEDAAARELVRAHVTGSS